MSNEKEYELIQDDVMVAATSGSNAKKEIEHYATMYGQDAPVEIYEVTRVKIYPVAAPSVASSAPADELPADITKDDALWRAGCKAFRSALNEMTGCDGYVVQKTYEAIRAHIVGRAAIAASQQAAPKAALTDAKIDEVIASMGWDLDPVERNDVGQFARAILAAAGPNAALVEALKAILLDCDPNSRIGQRARAALASLPPTQEA